MGQSCSFLVLGGGGRLVPEGGQSAQRRVLEEKICGPGLQGHRPASLEFDLLRDTQSIVDSMPR